MLSRAVALLLFAAACLASPAVAQIPGGSSGALAFVVTTCGTLGTPYVAGSTRIITIDVNGNLCGSGGSGGGNVNLTGINGTAPGPANPLYVNPIGLAAGTPSAGTTASGIECNVTTSPLSALTTAQWNFVNCDPQNNLRVAAAGGDPCQALPKSFAAINISASGSARIITGTASKKTYICHLDLVTNAANNVLLAEGTGSNCATNTFGLAGGTTAATGWNFSANGGIVLGNGGFTALGPPTADSNATAADVCLNPSAATQLTGQVSWVQAP